MTDTAETTTTTERVSSSTCFICNEPGHFARDCPQATSSSRPTGRRPMNCYNCGKPDHLARDCPNEQTNQSLASNAVKSVTSPGETQSSIQL
ncbi:cellular nucleic acid binding protein, putative [Perkinsus marinus ATCC 50983]|uniref:Cellular nucleic acid binding protein, putative n=1 Tax=Perkinsus marinus (strain ATCC 50983 / TXsc) TaxID=423536 RepID=C5LK15_PERM5|nr:cellular nucleic acid binding protein, putative [Perkinsus marinus ATCC 50983]EER02904.1 cellular nucleic acid binding protein, putative [Perkinsus marinus ATCC 50983]|eukprot:XP_002771088.1 cellular nucleic acid binding protein, putative [Perkinsus marinus ATCC 50983]